MGYIRFLGHSAFEIELDGKRIYVDPWIHNPQSPITLEDIDRADIVVITHYHGDHVGDAVDIAKKTGATTVGIYEIASEMESKGLEAVGMNIGGPAVVKGIKIVLTPAVHSSEKGSPTGVILIGKEATIYHAGDTGLFYDIALYAQLYPIDYAFVPIGGHFTMDPVQAGLFVSLFKPRFAIPMHFGTFPVLYGKAEEFAQEVSKRNIPTKVIVLKPGERITV